MAPLPFSIPAAHPGLLEGRLYVDLERTSDGRWLALTGDGRVHSEGNGLAPLLDLPGDPYLQEDLYLDVGVLGDAFDCLRSDGRIYEDDGKSVAFDLTGLSCGSLAISDDPPVLDEDPAKPPKPTILVTETVSRDGPSASRSSSRTGTPARRTS